MNFFDDKGYVIVFMEVTEKYNYMANHSNELWVEWMVSVIMKSAWRSLK